MEAPPDLHLLEDSIVTALAVADALGLSLVGIRLDQALLALRVEREPMDAAPSELPLA